MRPRPISAALLLAAIACVPDLARAQRRIPGRARPPGAAPAPRAAPEPAKKKKKVESWLAVRGGDLHVGTGQVLRNVTVLLGDDKIVSVGHDVSIPEGATIIEAKGKVVSPGFVAVSASGLGSPGNVTGKYADAVNAFDPMINLGLAAGLTAFCSRSGGGSAIGGQSAVIKLTPGDVENMVLKEPAVHSLAVPLGPTEWKNLREQVEKAKTFLEESKAHDAKRAAGDAAAQAPKKPAGIDPVLAVMQGEVRLFVNAMGGGGGGFGGGARRGGFDQDAIREALQVSELLDQGIVLVDPTEAWILPEEVARTGSMAIVVPRNRVRTEPDVSRRNGSNISMAQILADVGVPVAVLPPGGMFGGASVGTGGILGRDLNTLPIDAAFAVRGGLDTRNALRTITLDAAEILGVADRIGSVEEGKDADVLILDGDPLHYKTFVEVAIVNGKVVYEKDKSTFYAHIRK
jgi:hypothetical protein